MCLQCAVYQKPRYHRDGKGEMFAVKGRLNFELLEI